MYDPSILSENIRNYRKLRGMTQSELAERLFVTPQNISKWELGQSTPDVMNLCRLAEVLCVGVERLLGAPTDGAVRSLIAIDGGGTKTETVLFTEEGEVIGRHISGGSNPNTHGLDAAVSAIRSGLEALSVNEMAVTYIYAGIAGCGSGEAARAMASAIKRVCPTAKVNVQSDIRNVISAAEIAEDCIAVITGTGVSVFASVGERLQRYGGWGYLYDRSYSGYDLGREAIRTTLAEEEGTGRASAITADVEARLGYRPVDNLSRLYTLSGTEVASLSDCVFTAYDAGDGEALRIVREAVSALGETVRSARRMHPECGRILISGGLTAKRDVLTEHLGELSEEMIFPTAPQVYGAAVEAIGGVKSLTPEFSEKFLSSYEKFKKQSRL